MPEPIAPPVCPRRSRSQTLHDEVRDDPYFWLREKENPEVRAHLEAENAHADSGLAPTAELQDRLYTEMLARIQQTDAEVPYRKGDWLYYTRTEAGRQYPVYCRKPAPTDTAIEDGAGEQVYLDLNQLAEGQPFLALGHHAVNDDGTLLAYSLDTTGFREYQLYIQDLCTGELLADRVGRIAGVAWAAGGTTLFYLTEDEAKRSYRLYRHTLGEESTADTLVFEEADPLFRLTLFRSRSGAYVFMTSSSFTASEVLAISADRPAEARVLLPRQADHEYYADHHGEHFYLRTNDQGRNFRLVRAPVDHPERDHWEEVLPYRPAVMLEEIEPFQGFLVALEREDGRPQARILDAATGEQHRLTFPDPVYSASPQDNREFATPRFRFRYQSFATPPSVFDYDTVNRELALLKRQPVLGDFDPEKYVSRRAYATATDGVRIPISIVQRKDLGGGPHPTLLVGYGSYGYPYPITFSSDRLSLLDRGMVFAVAHIRGGGEMGKPWHDDGKMARKQNTFTDFIAVAEHLIADGVTSPVKLAITGGSAGGLLMGAVVNLRPELFGAVVSYVPFVDVLNTMLDDTLPLTVAEYLEWGNPNVKEHYELMRAYCPYTNLHAGAYPAMLIRTSLNDSQVMYWEPAKYVAKLRTLKTDPSPLLFKTNLDAGHGGASGRYDRLRDQALDYAFILTQLGVEAGVAPTS